MKRVSPPLFLIALVAATLGLALFTTGAHAQSTVCAPANLKPDGSCNQDLAGDPNKPVCVALPIFAHPKAPDPTLQVVKGCDNGAIPADQSGGPIIFYLKQLLRLMNDLVGGIIVLVLVIAGIQYITSAGDPANVKKAKGRVTAAITALVLYFMMVAILNFLIPGGAL